MTDWLRVVSAFAGGVAIGAAFFAGLWWTLALVLRRPAAAAWLGLSFLLRAALAVGGLWLLAGQDIVALAAAMAGFLLARVVATRRLGRDGSVAGGAPCD